LADDRLTAAEKLGLGGLGGESADHGEIFRDA